MKRGWLGIAVFATLGCGSAPAPSPAPAPQPAATKPSAPDPGPAPATTGPLSEADRVSIAAAEVNTLIPTDSARLRHRWGSLSLEAFLREVSEPNERGFTIERTACRGAKDGDPMACVEVAADPCAGVPECEGFPLAVIIVLRRDGAIELDHIRGPMAEPVRTLEDVERQLEMAP